MARKLNLICKGLSIAVLLLVPSFTAFAENRNKNEEAVELAISSAERLCGVVKREGVSTTGRLSGEGKAEADNILKKFADIGININGTIQREEFYNVLQKDLVYVINSNTDCKKEIFKTLIDKLLPNSASLGNGPTNSLGVEEPSEDIKEEVTENQTPRPSNISVRKLDVSSVKVKDENEYDNGYTASKMIDSNIDHYNYWSCKKNKITDIVLTFNFDDPKSLSKISIYSSRDGGSYTQPETVKLIYFNDSGEEVASETITLKNLSDHKQKYDLKKKVDNVSSVEIDLGDPKDKTASYITFNEIRFYGHD